MSPPRRTGAACGLGTLCEVEAEGTDITGMPTAGRVRRWILWSHHLWPVLLTGTLIGVGVLGLALVPVLSSRAPLLLVALRPTWGVLVLVGGTVPFVPTLLLAAFLRGLLDVGYFALARNNIRSVLLRSLGGSRLVAALTRPNTRTPLLWFCLVNTNIAVDAALGAGDVPIRRFLRFLAAGSLLQTAVYLTAARAASPGMRRAVDWLDAHMTWFVVGGLALALIRVAARSGRRVYSRSILVPGSDTGRGVRRAAREPRGNGRNTPSPDIHRPLTCRHTVDIPGNE
ncbi:hypothetical protein [Frankia sp. R82]|uniref:hypothetical protein n=1 Tax=Frankia sp. R82 TaxID=2950553 RepID=UPI002043E812|nr:hypothetical protein [Frankia sp. R82]MCM3882201.1 hypothetical protein [Frankia sp. R82]